TGNPIADYLLGYPSAANAQALVTPTYRRGWYYALYANDDFKISQNLTLNLGLRYEVQPPLIEKFNHIGEFDFATGTQRLAGQNGVPRGLYSTDSNDLGPRIGIAWRPFGRQNTAVRA